MAIRKIHPPPFFEDMALAIEDGSWSAPAVTVFDHQGHPVQDNRVMRGFGGYVVIDDRYFCTVLHITDKGEVVEVDTG